MVDRWSLSNPLTLALFPDYRILVHWRRVLLLRLYSKRHPFHRVGVALPRTLAKTAAHLAPRTRSFLHLFILRGLDT
jgi:hypothetical protein